MFDEKDRSSRDGREKSPLADDLQIMADTSSETIREKEDIVSDTPQSGAVKYEPIRWSEDNLVMFNGGYAWTSLILYGQPEHICLGKENEVKAVLSGEKPISDIRSHKRAAAFIRIFEIREEINGTDTGAGGLERRRPIRTIRYRQKNARLPKDRKRIPGR